ncbi:Cof-type HAD-IIB family hydrolase [Enterococcus sp. LJL120]
MPKVIFIDVDGTLVDYENHLPASAVTAIRQARSRGHFVYICTGRSKAEIYDEILDIGFYGIIGANGAYIESQEEVIFQQTLTPADSLAIVDWLQKRGLEFYLECTEGLFASRNFAKRGQPVMQEYSRRKGKQGVQQITVKDIFPEMIFEADLNRRDVNKISFILESYQDYLDAAADFPHLKAGTWGGKGEVALFGDLGNQDIDKAFGVDLILQHLSLERKDTFAFGDAKVDIPMLEYCAVGVAMASGGPEIKEMADFITDSVDEDGLYNAFKHFDLIE